MMDILQKTSSFFGPLSKIPLSIDTALVSRTMTGGMVSSNCCFFGGGIGMGGVGVLPVDITGEPGQCTKTLHIVCLESTCTN